MRGAQALQAVSCGGGRVFLMGRKPETLCALTYRIVSFCFFAVLWCLGAQGRKVLSRFLI